MNSRIMDKLGELLAEGTQREVKGSPVSMDIDTVWFSLLIAQSQIIVLLEDIRKMMSMYTLNRFELIDISEEEQSNEKSSSNHNQQ